MCEQTGMSRRELVRAAVGAVTVASEGLLLPADAGEVAAREGANDGRLGGRRGKDHRGRNKHKRRDHGNKKDKEGQPPGRGPFEFRKTALTVKSFTDPLFTLTFYYRVKTGLDEYGPWIQAHSTTPEFGASARFASDRFRVGVLVSAPGQVGQGQMFLDVRNLSFGTPKGSAHYRFSGGLDPVRNDLGTIAMSERAFSEMSYPVTGFFAVGETFDASFDVRRLADSDDYIEFQLIISNRSSS